MQIDVRHVHLELSEALDAFARERLERALHSFTGRVTRVELRIQDVNGPRGGLDKQCTASADIAGSRRKIVVKSASTDAYEAVQEACGRLAETVSRVVTRRRQLARHAAPWFAAGRRDRLALR